jgi:hypothetical protein
MARKANYARLALASAKERAEKAHRAQGSRPIGAPDAGVGRSVVISRDLRPTSRIVAE